MTLADEITDLTSIQEFKKGCSFVGEKHNLLAQSALKLLSSGNLSQNERLPLLSHSGELDSIFQEIQSRARNLVSNLNFSSLEREALLEYHNIFKESIDSHRVSFIIFFKTFQYLSIFSRETSSLWQRVKKIINSIQLAPESKFRMEMLNYYAGPGLKLCESVDLFCSRMAIILRVDPSRIPHDASAGVYSRQIEYQISSVFSPALRDTVERVSATKAPQPERSIVLGDDDFMEYFFEEHQPEKSATPVSVVSRSEDARLNTGGSMSWNQTYHYFFSYDPSLQEEERKSFADVVYIDTHMGAEKEKLRSNLIMNVSKKLSTGSKDIEKEYEDFLRGFFEAVADICVLNFQIPESGRWVFLYHLGPGNFHMLVRRFFHEFGTGSMHRTTKGKVIQKFVPVETVKKNLITWWKSRVLTEVRPRERDSYPLFSMIARSVKDIYRKLSDRAVAQYNSLPEEVRFKKSRTDLFRENLNKWVGAHNLIVCRRFLKTK